MNVYLIGASGAIGFSLFKYLKKKIKVTGTYYKNKKPGLTHFALGNKVSENQLIKKLKPNDIVFFLSSFTEVAWVFDNKRKSSKLNFYLTKKFLSKLIIKNIKFFYFSSAEVFNGKKGFYNENSKINPVNFYGKLKFRIEEFLKKTKNRNCHIIRLGRIIDMTNNYRCMIEDCYKTLLTKNAKMASDNLFTITHQRDFNKAILKVIKKKKLPKILHICSGHAISRTRFADVIIKVSKGSNIMKYKICKFNELNYKEKRAAKNNLDSSFTSKLLNVKYIKPEKIIKEKIKIIEKKKITN